MAAETTSTDAPEYERTGWARRRSKVHIHEAIAVEIRCGRPEITIHQHGRLCADHRSVAARVAASLASLIPLACVTVFLGEQRAHPRLIADAIWWTDCMGADRPHGVPADAQLLELPYSEVCMHMRLAGRLRWVAPLDRGMSQIYDHDGRPHSFPILRSEAGLDPAVEPTSCRQPAHAAQPALSKLPN